MQRTKEGGMSIPCFGDGGVGLKSGSQVTVLILFRFKTWFPIFVFSQSIPSLRLINRFFWTEIYASHTLFTGFTPDRFFIDDLDAVYWAYSFTKLTSIAVAISPRSIS
jgi:hypothetical protein